MDGKRVLVTGGSTGIGLAVATALAARGARVAIVGRQLSALQEALERLPGEGHEQLAFDVSDDSAWRSAIARLDGGGALDGLVTAAGVLGPVGQLQDVAMDEFAATISINLVGTALALHHALPRLLATAGRAVTFSGGGGTGPLAHYDAYAASKAGVVRLTENIAVASSVPVNLWLPASWPRACMRARCGRGRRPRVPPITSARRSSWPTGASPPRRRRNSSRSC